VRDLLLLAKHLFSTNAINATLYDRLNFVFLRDIAAVILNRALAGYQRLLARGTKFKLPTAVEQATARWIQQANPLPAFIAACCQKNAQARCLMQDFYHAFQIGPKTWVTPSPRPRIPSKATCDTSVLQQRKPTKE
jgi:phage/plasmid-associated DNA primase